MCPGPRLCEFHQLFILLLAVYMVFTVALIILINLILLYCLAKFTILNKMLMIGIVLFVVTYWLPVNLWCAWLRYLV